MFLNHLKKVVLLSSILLISGCSLTPKPIPVEIKTVPVQIPIAQPTMPRPIDYRETHWYVVSESNIDTFMEDIRNQSGGQLVFVAMTIADYENMAYNMQEIKRYLEQSKSVILYYIEATEVKDLR